MIKKNFIVFVCLLFGLIGSVQAGNSEKHYTVIVSLDGFRWDYAEMYDTPCLDSIAKVGVKAVMTPSFPSKTFPNHYTIATGLVPDHHGIVANTFWDAKRNALYSIGNSATRNNPDYYGGEPIWITAQKQGLITGNLYWVGSDIPIKGVLPTYYKVYAHTPRLTFEERVQGVVDLLNLPADKRPRLVMAYFEQPDHDGHTFGPQSIKTRHTIEELDRYMGELWDKIKALPIGDQVNLIITSDHGMTALSPERAVSVSRYIKKEWVDRIEGDLPALIYTRAKYRDSVYCALQGVPHIRVWKKEDMPAYLNYGTNKRVGDIVVLPDLGWLFTDKPVTLKGSHGFDPSYSDMKVVFRACGPDFKEGYESQGFVNVDIYPLLAHLLQIVPEKTDGNFDRVKGLLK